MTAGVENGMSACASIASNAKHVGLQTPADIVVQTPCIRDMEGVNNGKINSILLRQTAVDTEVYYRVLN